MRPDVAARTRTVEFEAFFRASSADVRRFAVRAGGADVADEVVTETFMVVWRRWDDLPAQPDDRRAWLFGVARNTLRHAHRSRSRSEALTLKVSGTQTRADAVSGDVADAVADEDRVARLLAGLPTSEREAMALVVWSGLSPQQAARVLGCSVTALSTRLSRARRHLAAVLADEGSEVDR